MKIETRENGNAQGSYEDCVYERDQLLKQHAKDGLTLSDCTIIHHSVRI